MSRPKVKTALVTICAAVGLLVLDFSSFALARLDLINKKLAVLATD